MMLILEWFLPAEQGWAVVYSFPLCLDSFIDDLSHPRILNVHFEKFTQGIEVLDVPVNTFLILMVCFKIG